MPTCDNGHTYDKEELDQLGDVYVCPECGDHIDASGSIELEIDEEDFEALGGLGIFVLVFGLGILVHGMVPEYVGYILVVVGGVVAVGVGYLNYTRGGSNGGESDE